MSGVKTCGQERHIPSLLMWHFFGLEYATPGGPRCCERPGHEGDHRGLITRGGKRKGDKRWVMLTWDDEQTYYTEAPA